MRSRHVVATPRSQRGLTLFIGLIMLVLTTLIVLASFNLGRSNLSIVTNAQQRTEGLAAAQQTIEAAIESPLLTTNPAAVFPTPCAAFSGANPNTLCYDVNNDTVDDVKVELAPAPKCVVAKPTQLLELDLTKESDRQCTVGVAPECFEVGAACPSLCADTVWDIRASAQTLDPSGAAVAGQGATAIVDQGIRTRVAKDDVATSCP